MCHSFIDLSIICTYHAPPLTLAIYTAFWITIDVTYDLPSTVLRTCALTQKYMHMQCLHTLMLAGRKEKLTHRNKHTRQQENSALCLRWKLSPVSWCTPLIRCNPFPKMKSNLWKGLVSFLQSPFNISRIQETSLSLSFQMIVFLKQYPWILRSPDRTVNQLGNPSKKATLLSWKEVMNCNS